MGRSKIRMNGLLEDRSAAHAVLWVEHLGTFFVEREDREKSGDLLEMEI